MLFIVRRRSLYGKVFLIELYNSAIMSIIIYRIAQTPRRFQSNGDIASSTHTSFYNVLSMNIFQFHVYWYRISSIET